MVVGVGVGVGVCVSGEQEEKECLCKRRWKESLRGSGSKLRSGGEAKVSLKGEENPHSCWTTLERLFDVTAPPPPSLPQCLFRTRPSLFSLVLCRKLASATNDSTAERTRNGACWGTCGSFLGRAFFLRFFLLSSPALPQARVHGDTLACKELVLEDALASAARGDGEEESVVSGQAGRW